MAKSLGESVPLRAIAHYSDGTSWDVTKWTIFKAEDSSAVEVDSASASLDHSVIIWNTETGVNFRSLKGHSRGVSSLCFLKDTKTLVSAGIDQSLRVWNLHSGELVRSLSIRVSQSVSLNLKSCHDMPVLTSRASVTHI